MTDVLDQSDIDALLSAVSSGDVEDDNSTPQIFSRSRRDRESVEIKDYDFKRPERISKDQMRAMQTLHEAFARNLGASLSGFLRTIVEVTVAQVEQMTYFEFISSLPNPTSFNLIDASALDGQICLELSPLIIYPIIDRLLGGSNEELFIPQRPMTLIEVRLIQQVLDRAMSALSETWESIRPIDFKLGEMESNPHIVQIVPPNEVVVVIGFEVMMTTRAGTMSLCLPFNVIEPIMEDLSTQSWFAAGKHRIGDWGKVIGDRLASASVEISGVLTETTIRVSDLRSLDVGDLITTEKPATAPVVINVGGIPKFLGQIGQFRGKRALRVQGSIRGGERV